MNKKVKKLVLNLASFIFDDVEFKRLISYINLELFNNARLYVEEKLEYLETTLVLYLEEGVTQSKIQKCRKLDDLLTEEYINSLNTI